MVNNATISANGKIFIKENNSSGLTHDIFSLGGQSPSLVVGGDAVSQQTNYLYSSGIKNTLTTTSVWKYTKS